MSHSPHDTSTSESDDLSHITTGVDRRLSEIGPMRPESINRRQSNLNDVELERINTYRLQHRSTVGSGIGITPREQWLPLGAGKPHPPPLPDPEEYIVEFNDANDPLHPQNWSLGRKICISATLAYTTFVSSFTSAIYSSAVGEISVNFDISTEVAVLGVTLYVLGFASGPTVWAPASELIGRRWPICIGMFGYSIFAVASATSKDVQTLMLTRFFSGFFSASPIAIVPAVFADIWNNQTRGVAVAMFAMAVFVGPFVSVHWRLHHNVLSGMEVDHVHLVHNGMAGHWPLSYFPERDICALCPGGKGRHPATTDTQLGNPRATRRDRG
jgi:DHA1 family multidrug resistance protein-like MFS transporter